MCKVEHYLKAVTIYKPEFIRKTNYQPTSWNLDEVSTGNFKRCLEKRSSLMISRLE